MKTTALVSLDCEAGVARRYIREPGNKPRETGRLVFDKWQPGDETVEWNAIATHLLGWGQDYEPPEDDGPRPTPPLRTQKAA